METLGDTSEYENGQDTMLNCMPFGIPTLTPEFRRCVGDFFGDEKYNCKLYGYDDHIMIRFHDDGFEITIQIEPDYQLSFRIVHLLNANDIDRIENSLTTENVLRKLGYVRVNTELGKNNASYVMEKKLPFVMRMEGPVLREMQRLGDIITTPGTHVFRPIHKCSMPINPNELN